MKKITMATLALCTASLMGCSSNDDEEPEELVLPVIVNQFETKVLWQESVGDGVGHYYSKLSPTIYKETVYVAGRNGKVKALSLETGDVIWQKDVRHLILL